MSWQIDSKTREHWQKIANNLRQINELVNECTLTLILNLHITNPEAKPMAALNKIQEAAGGMSYLFQPQIEWTGGDSNNPKNFKTNLPHIAQSH
jgi:hypothetical protein